MGTDDSAPTGFGLSTLGQVAVTVRDLETMTAFYRDTLGLRFLFSAPPGMSFFDCDGIRLLLGRGDDEARPNAGTVLYFQVGDITEAHRLLAARGVTFVHPPHRAHADERHELWLAFLRDPEGNVVALMSEVARA